VDVAHLPEKQPSAERKLPTTIPASILPLGSPAASREDVVSILRGILSCPDRFWQVIEAQGTIWSW
jgi:hypothetical protein